jgi:15-cis-phytoene synthase
MSDQLLARAAQPVDVITKQAKTNFYYSFLSLPPIERKAIETVYAFCRLMDDIADEDLPVANAKLELERWRTEVHRCFIGQPLSNLGRSIQEVLINFPISEQYFQDMISGMEMDLAKTRYRTFAELQRYCYHVAGVTGLMCIEIFGYQDAQTQEYARNLGTALQLVNILRDLKEDADRQRIYLPAEDLAAFGYTETELLNNVYNEKFAALMRFETSRARHFFQQARQVLPQIDRPRMFAAEIMASIYFRILEKIEMANYNVWEQRVSLSTWEKIRVALPAWWRCRWGQAPNLIQPERKNA